MICMLSSKRSLFLWCFLASCWGKKFVSFAWNTSLLSSRRDVLATAAASIWASASAAVFPSAAGAVAATGGSIRYGTEDIMKPKAHGTSDKPVQEKLLYGVSRELADKICNYNRHYAESAGYFTSTHFRDVVLQSSNDKPITFYDSVTGQPLFVAPIGRSAEQFIAESEIHGWPSFRDSEVVWDNVRILPNGETVSIWGTHLGHNLPDRTGNRYCINLVSIAGQPNNLDEEESTGRS